MLRTCMCLCHHEGMKQSQIIVHKPASALSRRTWTASWISGLMVIALRLTVLLRRVTCLLWTQWMHFSRPRSKRIILLQVWCDAANFWGNVAGQTKQNTAIPEAATYADLSIIAYMLESICRRDACFFDSHVESTEGKPYERKGCNECHAGAIAEKGDEGHLNLALLGFACRFYSTFPSCPC